MPRPPRLCFHCGKPVNGKPGPVSRVAPFLDELRARRAAGESLKVLAADYGIDITYVSKLTRGRRLAHEFGYEKED